MIIDKEHQARIIGDTWAKRSWNIFGDTGTGKTRIAIRSAEQLAHAGQINGLVVVAPGGVHLNWRDIEIPLHMTFPHRILTWSSKLTKKGREALVKSFVPNLCGLNIFLMNIEALTNPASDAALALAAFLQTHNALLVLDESTSIRRPEAMRTKTFLGLISGAKYYRNLSGFPAPERATDLWTQCIALQRPDLFPYKSWYAFRNTFTITERETIRVAGGRLQEIVRIVGAQRQRELRELLLNFSSIISKEECLDLPPKTYQRRFYEMSKEQRHLYATMQKRREVEYEGGYASTTNRLGQLEKLNQIASGYLCTDDGQWIDIPHQTQYNAVDDILAGEAGKVALWSIYTRQIDDYVKHLSKTSEACAFYGDTSKDDRPKIVQDFQTGGLRYFVGNPATGKFSWTLTAASTVVYLSNRHEVEPRHQSEDRFHRIGQTKSVAYIDVLASDSIQSDILDAVMNKRNAGAECLSDSWTKKLYGELA